MPDDALDDGSVFRDIKSRLKRDVGKIVTCVEQALKDPAKGVPRMPLVRALFPVAESIGFLIYGGTSQQNLLRLLKEDLSQTNVGYGVYSGVLITMWRHALTHQDFPRRIVHSSIMLVPTISVDEKGLEHLDVYRINGADIPNDNLVDSNKVFTIVFNAKQFYFDLLSICDLYSQMDYGGIIAQRYESWKVYFPGDTLIDREVKKEMEQIQTENFLNVSH